ncbi:MAG TPA: M20 family metallopeptidase [Acidimicrobiales bacterium]|nr:M20 family metallopeptidase [Acidimicrobiales bacterium]
MTDGTTGGAHASAGGLIGEAAGLLGEMTELRRAIHRRPELGLDLPTTQQLVLEALDGLGARVVTGSATTSVIAEIDGGRPGPSTLLRADMDALPMPEETGLPFASQVEGAMHACGHDAHTAMLLGAAKLLSRHRAELAGRAVLMFQPGEEGHAGARVMLDEGLLDDHGPIDRAFAIHVTPMLPSGMVATRPGPLLASATAFVITVTGRGGHASMPHDAVDPVPAACEMALSFQTMVTRTIPVFEPAVVTVGRVTAGTTSNVIPETAVLEGTIRAVSESSAEAALEGVRRVAAGVAAAHGCTFSYEQVGEGYPVTVNDPRQAAGALEAARALAGPEGAFEMPYPVMGAEDWSFVLRRVPGAMAFLGVAPPGVERPAPNHSSRMLLDEGAMAVGAALHAAVAMRPSPGGDPGA